MAGAVLDTHAALWYVTGDPRLSKSALESIESAISAGEPCLVPSICMVEATYLVEKNRIPQQSFRFLLSLLRDPSSGLRMSPLDFPVCEALARVSRDDVPDLPDRIIAATASAFDLPLVTRDGKIRSSGIRTIW